MSKKITLLGSTGSIGTQSLDVIRAQGYEVFGLSAHSHVEKILEQIEEFHPRYVCMTDPDAAARLEGQVQFLLVNMTDGSRETLESAQAYLEETGISTPAYFDTSYSAAIAYGVTSLPTTYFIDAQGGAVARAMGAIDADTLQKGIDMILPPAE